MFTSRKKETAIRTEALDLHPIIHISDCLLDFQRQLSESEVDSLDELQEVQNAFRKVLEENASLREELDSFHALFGTVGDASGQFANVREEIATSVGLA